MPLRADSAANCLWGTDWTPARRTNEVLRSPTNTQERTTRAGFQVLPERRRNLILSPAPGQAALDPVLNARTAEIGQALLQVMVETLAGGVRSE